jgi:DUF2911 family protein
MKLTRVLASGLLIVAMAGFGGAQDAPKKKGPASPPAETSIEIGGKKISIKYSAPSMRGRKIFGGADALQPDNSVWRAGANNATALHTDANLTIGKINVPAGDCTLYVQLGNPWQLVVSKQTGQWGINRDGSTTLDPSQEVGRTPMTMSKPPAPIEVYKMTLAATGGNKGKLTLEWENVIASVDLTAK